ncbi:MAG: M48 family metallopeptidase [Hydrogenophilales bacterium]|nr:M48 family metallopeptidase [Hydrogenophilales bacterium]
MSSPIANTLAAVLAACCFAGQVRALDLPDLGDVSRVSLSESREAALGGRIMRQIRSDKGYLRDAELSEYLNNLGDRLAAANPSPSHHFYFFAVNDPSINAFALPGGYVGVHTGLIAAARNESELAGVLAHEIAHVSQNHIARIVDVQKSSTLTTLAALAVAILAARSDQGQVSQAAIATAQAMSIQNQLDFTREHEREADRIGLQTLANADFSPSGMATFFERLQAQTRFAESSAPAYLRTHPLTFERIADIQNRLGETPSRQVPDSLEFKLARAKVMATQGEAPDAVRRFRGVVAEHPEDVEALYALTASALRAGDRGLAVATLAKLEQRAATPMVASLAARVMLDGKQTSQALERLRAALQKHGTTRPLAEAHADALLHAERGAEAKKVVTEYLRVWADDPEFLELLARANFALGLNAEGHLAQADALRQQDLLAPAIDQLESARKAGGDYYTQSIIDARLRELQDRLKQDKNKGERAW